MAGNPRIDDLRKRIEKDPGSRLFAQLSEELRKDGELEESIRVAREGLKKHPSYPSARMTLGRALLDTGDWAAARTEFELVLKTAADNILASRYLGECLEHLGERDAAIARYKSTLAMAPGEKHVIARLQELAGTSAAPGRTSAPAPMAAPTPVAAPAASSAARPHAGLRPGSTRPTAAAAAPPPAAPPMAALTHTVAPTPPATPKPEVATPPPPPIPLSMVEGEMELETSESQPEAAPAAASALPPIPLAAVDEEFELEAPHEAPVPGWAASIRPLPVADQAPPPTAPTPAAAAPTPTALPAARPEPAPEPSAYPAPSPAPSALTSPTLGELYFNQGFTAKAIEVYRELSAREPGNERLAARLRELEKVQENLAENDPVPAGAPPSSAADADGDRRQAIERTIARLEGLLSAIRKG